MQEKVFFKQDSVLAGIILGVGSELLTALLLWAGLTVAGEPVSAHVSWFGACFVAPVLILRHYARKKEQPLVTKTLITVLFVTFVVFMFVYLKK